MWTGLLTLTDEKLAFVFVLDRFSINTTLLNPNPNDGMTSPCD